MRRLRTVSANRGRLAAGEIPLSPHGELRGVVEGPLHAAFRNLSPYRHGHPYRLPLRPQAKIDRDLPSSEARRIVAFSGFGPAHSLQVDPTEISGRRESGRTRSNINAHAHLGHAGFSLQFFLARDCRPRSSRSDSACDCRIYRVSS
jgi:hypothetical protein